MILLYLVRCIYIYSCIVDRCILLLLVWFHPMHLYYYYFICCFIYSIFEKSFKNIWIPRNFLLWAFFKIKIIFNLASPSKCLFISSCGSNPPPALRAIGFTDESKQAKGLLGERQPRPRIVIGRAGASPWFPFYIFEFEIVKRSEQV